MRNSHYYLNIGLRIASSSLLLQGSLESIPSAHVSAGEHHCGRRRLCGGVKGALPQQQRKEEAYSERLYVQSRLQSRAQCHCVRKGMTRGWHGRAAAHLVGPVTMMVRPCTSLGMSCSAGILHIRSFWWIPTAVLMRHARALSRTCSSTSTVMLRKHMILRHRRVIRRLYDTHTTCNGMRRSSRLLLVPCGTSRQRSDCVTIDCAACWCAVGECDTQRASSNQ